MNTPTPTLVATVKWLRALTKPYLKWVYLSAVSALVLVAFNLLKALLVANLVEHALQGDATALARIVIYLVPSVLLAIMATWATSYAARRAGILSARDLKSRLVNHITRAKTAHIERHHTGELLTRLNTDANTIGTFLAEQFPNLLFQPLMFLCSSVFLLKINWKLFLASYALLPLLFYCANAMNRKGAQYSKGYYDSLDEATSSIKQSLDGIATVKTYNLGEQMVGKSRASFDKALKPLLRREMIDACSLPFFFLTEESPRIICVLVGAYLTWQGEMTLGGLIAATQLVSYVSAPANALMRLLRNTRRTSVAVGRIAEILDLPTEPAAGTPITPASGPGCLAFHNVTFGYEPEAPILRNVSFTVPSRGITALVGGSGEGKSTAMSLISGFYTPQTGRVTVFGQDIAASELTSLRQLVAYVPQDSHLFPGTIADNIRFGNLAASDEQLLAAAERSRVAEFAMSLPGKLNTQLGERGVGLSGGQRQRVAIARAALKEAPVMLLDEPTAALDPLSEDLINKTLKDLSAAAAVIVASHRLSTVEIADHILVLEEGRVVEQGSYQELLRKQGSFARLFAAQLSAQDTGKEEVANYDN